MSKTLFYNLSPIVVGALAFGTTYYLKVNNALVAVILTFIATTIATTGVVMRCGEKRI